MKRTLTVYDASRLLLADYNADWSHAGSLALARYVDEYYDDDWEFCAVELRCDYAEYKSLEDWAVDYWGGIEEAQQGMSISDLYADDAEDKIRKYVSDNTTLIEFDGGCIVCSF